MEAALGFLSPKRRLNTLFTFHIAFSCLWGITAFLFPWMYGVFFTEGSWDHGVHRGRGDDGDNVAHFMIRLYGALLAAQAWIVHSIRGVKNGTMQRNVLRGYFFCFLASLFTVCTAHFADDGTMAGHFWVRLIIFAVSVWVRRRGPRCRRDGEKGGGDGRWGRGRKRKEKGLEAALLHLDVATWNVYSPPAWLLPTLRV